MLYLLRSFLQIILVKVFKLVVLLLHPLHLILGDHRVHHGFLAFVHVEELHFIALVDLWHKRWLHSLIIYFVTVVLFEKWVRKDFFSACLSAHPLRSVFLQQLEYEVHYLIRVFYFELVFVWKEHFCCFYFLEQFPLILIVEGCHAKKHFVH